MSVTAREPRTAKPERDAKEASGAAAEAAEEQAAGAPEERAKAARKPTAEAAAEARSKSSGTAAGARREARESAAEVRGEPGRTPAEASPHTPAATRLFGSRGRHRRPRPRKVLLAAGGLALAAGALSLVRMSPDSGVSGLGATESGPAPAPGTDAEPDRSTNAAATLTPNAPKATPSATSAMGGLGTAPTTDSIAVPTPARTTTAPHGPGGTPAPTPPAAGPGTPTPEPPPTTPRATASAPAPETPGGPPTSPTPTQQPRPDDNSVCIPIIGLCVDPLPLSD